MWKQLQLATTRAVKYQEHVPCSYGYYIVSDIPEYQPGFKSDIAAEVFLDEMISIADEFNTKPKPELTPSERHH